MQDLRPPPVARLHGLAPRGREERFGRKRDRGGFVDDGEPRRLRQLPLLALVVAVGFQAQADTFGEFRLALPGLRPNRTQSRGRDLTDYSFVITVLSAHDARPLEDFCIVRA